MSSENQRVGQRARRGITWNLAGAIVTNSIRVAVIAVLGRVLDSSDFGLVAVAVSINAILYGIRDIGLATALVQRDQLHPEHLRTGFATSLYLGVLVTTGLFLSARPIAELYGIPASEDVLRAMSVVFVLRGSSTISRAICRRALNFRVIALIDTIAFGLGSCVSIVCALGGAGPWALVAGYLVEELTATIAFLYAAPPKVSFRVDRTRLRELMTIGTGQTIGQIAGVLATYGDNFVVGRALGEHALGYYTRAYDLIKLPSMVFANIVGSVLFPAYSRIQDDRPRLASNFRRMTFVNALVLIPASAALVVLAPEVIEILMGPGWDEAVLPFRILACTMLLRTTQKLSAIVATAAGAVNAIAVAFLLYMVFVIAGAAISIEWGIVGVAATTSVAIVVVTIACSRVALSTLTLSSWELVAAHFPGLWLGALVCGVGWPFAAMLRRHELSGVVVFAATLLLSMLLCALPLAVWLVRRRADFDWLRGELQRLWLRRRR